MMATEATSENFATSSTIPDHELNTTETPSQNVPSEPTIVNGNTEKDDNKQDAEPIEASVYSAEVSVSGGSDTEASKTETSKTAADGKGHVRTASTVKKVASFKPVSVNKTFLAAKGATTVTPSKLGDKGSATAPATQTGPSTSATLRPRLVAKSGSGLRDSSARTSPASNGGKPGAPDASVVWNKNRPAPAPSPKAYTDEELKQQYGIHLATRIQTDDIGGKQANWADIDDDDEDWAPASMEWSDGTKITLPQADDPPPPAPVPVPSPALKEIFAPEAAKPKSPAPPQASNSPTVKPSGLGSGRAGLVLKGASEKPTLVAKPPGPPTPVKSPWAPLPPVDKATPITVDIPQNQQQQQQSRFGQRDPHGFQGMPPPPAKEIAADDFSRSWRENSNTSRELFDSKSGRYEPVNDNRRGSRNDPRHPSLLQRPSQQDGPAEPSAAFQTHRASGQDGGYGRRRTSSNVSGGSGNFVRRMSRGHDMPPPHDALNARRGSLAAVSDDPSSPRNFSPSGQYQNQRGHQNQQWQSRASPAVSHPSPQSVHGQPIPPVAPTDIQAPPVAPYEDPIEAQKKIMRQTRELAIKRRQEAEAKEEAERKERIRLKLEAMGPAPEKKKKDAPKEEKAVPTHIQARKPSDAAGQLVPEPGEDSNVGGSESVDQLAAPMSSLDVKSPDKRDERPNGIHSVASSAQSHKLPQENRSSQSWQNNSSSGSDRYQPWAPAPSQQTSRNVWGPPSNDRTLGNGTFNPELSRLPEMHQSNPGPIGPPNRGNGHLQQRGNREPYAPRPAPIGPPNRQQPHPSSQKQQQERAAVAASGWANITETLAAEDRLMREQQEQDIATRRDLEAQGIAPEIAMPEIKDTWREVSLNEDGTRTKIKANHTLVHDASQPTSSSWKNQEEATTRPIFEEQDPARRRHFDSVGNQPQPNDTWRSPSNINTSTPARGSRFFPNNRDTRLEEQNTPFDRPGSPSPPPPTMAGHPAYDGDSAHPHVSFPRPSPVVKLPPAVLAPIGPPKPASFAAAVTTPAVPQISQGNAYQGRHDFSTRATPSYQDIRRQEQPTAGGWQDRINSLIGRKNSPPKSHALAVDSSSKNALELPNTQYAATVSLPSSVTGDLSVDDGAVVSKPAAEECFEEQEMGSLPVVKVPISAPALAWSLAPSPHKSLPKRFAVSHPTSVDSIHFPQHISNNCNIITIKVPGQEGVKTVSIPVPRQSSNPRRGGSRGGSRHPSSSHPRGGRGRDSSSGFPSPSLDNVSVSSSPGRGGRGGRGYASGNWSRNGTVHT